MLLLALRGVRHNGGRYAATLVAILTGVAFFAASGFLGDRVIDALEGDVGREFASVDVAVVPEEADGEADSLAVDSSFVEDIRLPGDRYDELLAVDGVEGGAGVVTGSVAFLAGDGSTFAEGATGRLWISDDELNPLDLAEGQAPDEAGEVTVDAGTADGEDIEVGDQLTLLTVAGQFPVSVSGITTFGSADSLDSGGTVALPEATAFDWLASGQVEYEEAYLRGTGDEAALTAAVADVVPEGYRAQTGGEFVADQQGAVAGFGQVLKQGLQAFALLALFVGGFVIFNTFSVIVAQRLRELAVLAAIGATPRQLKRSLRLEGLLIGLLGSVLGVAVGYALAFALVAILGLAGVDLPGSGMALSPPVAVQGIVLGTVITFLSVTIPARRAGRTEPMEALRVTAAESPRPSRRRVIATAALLGLGTVRLVTGGSALTVASGAVMLFVGVILAGPLIATGGTRLLRPLLSSLGLEGRLAADNAARNPQRTSTTANALLIGVFLVALVTVAGTSARDFAVSELQELDSSDYSISSDGGTIDDQLVDDLLAIEDVQAVVPYRTESVTIDGEPAKLSTGAIADLSAVAALDVEAGSYDDLADGTIAVAASPDDAADPIAVGDTVTVLDEAGDRADLEVVALIEGSIDTTFVGSLTDEQTFDRLVGDTAPTEAFIDVASGAQSDVEDQIDAVTALRPDISVFTGDTFAELVGTVFDFLISAVDGLLLMSVVVALIGIVNTLTLSILERRRELGLLRIMGMVDTRVQRMVRLESVLIAVLGTVSGLALGTFVGWATIYAIDRLAEADIPFRFPVVPLVGVLLAGVVLGALAAWLPAKRSTRLEVLDAIAAT